MKRLIVAALLAASVAAPAAAFTDDVSGQPAPLDEQSLVELRMELSMYEESLLQDMAQIEQDCTDRGCMFVRIAQAYSFYFQQLGYDYDATIRASVQAMQQDPMTWPRIERASLDKILFHTILLAKLPEFERERRTLLAEGTIKPETVAAVQAFQF